MNYNDLIPELTVTDIEKSKAFYIDLLGFKIEYERPEDKFVFISLGGIQLMLEEAKQADLAQLNYPFGKGINFSFGVDDVEAIYKKLKADHYPIKRALEKRTFRVNDAFVTPLEFSVLDPDGYYIRITD